MRKRNGKIDENQCRINTIHLTEGERGGGALDNLGAKTSLILKYFANGVFRCHLDSGVSQLLLCYQQPSY